MANAVYPLYKEAVLGSAANSSLTAGNVKIALLDNTYTYSAAHQFFSDLTGVVISSGNLTTKTIASGVFDADTAVSVAVSGNQVVALAIYIDTGVGTTSRLVAYLDTGITGFPVTPNGGNINVEWDAAGIFAL